AVDPYRRLLGERDEEDGFHVGGQSGCRRIQPHRMAWPDERALPGREIRRGSAGGRLNSLGRAPRPPPRSRWPPVRLATGEGHEGVDSQRAAPPLRRAARRFQSRVCEPSHLSPCRPCRASPGERSRPPTDPSAGPISVVAATAHARYTPTSSPEP